MKRFAGFGAANASERLEDRIPAPTGRHGHQIVNGQQARDVSGRVRQTTNAKVGEFSAPCRLGRPGT